jgi:hypothetical protein
MHLRKLIELLAPTENLLLPGVRGNLFTDCSRFG